MKTDAELDELVILPEIERALFPLRREELAQLEQSVLEEGIRDPLVVWVRADGTKVLVDGHHRYRLAHKHGLVFEAVEREFVDLDEVLDWVDRNQLARRNLTDEQRLVVLGRMYEHRKKAPHRPRAHEDKKELNLSSFSPAPAGHDATARSIAGEAGVSQATVRRAAEFAKAVEALQEVSPEAVERVLRGEVRDAITRLPRVAKDRPEALPSVAEKIASGTARSIAEAAQLWKREALPVTPPLDELPDRFSVILADPPWRYDFSISESRDIENQYPTMSLEELKALRIPAEDDAVLFLWATAPKLKDALELMEAWGFEYTTCAVWDKERIGMGYWFRVQHELLLVGTRGSPPVPDPQARVSSVIRSPREAHSRKPDVVYEIIETMFPSGKLLELFARANGRERWVAWGNEAQ